MNTLTPRPLYDVFAQLCFFYQRLTFRPGQESTSMTVQLALSYNEF